MGLFNPEAAEAPPFTERPEPIHGFDDVEYSAGETQPISNSVFNPQNSTAPSEGPHNSIMIGIGVFWGLLGVVVLALALFAILYFRRRRLGRQGGADGQQNGQGTDASSQQDTSVSRKPRHIPVVVVLPDDQVAFGWKIVVDDDKIKESGEDDKIDSISPKDSYSSLEGEGSATHGHNAV